MQIFIEYFPLLVFFIINSIAGIYWATGSLIVAAFVQIFYYKIKKEKIPTKQWIIFGLIFVFGGLTIYLQNDAFLYVTSHPNQASWAGFVTYRKAGKSCCRKESIELQAIPGKKLLFSKRFEICFLGLGLAQHFIQGHINSSVYNESPHCMHDTHFQSVYTLCTMHAMGTTFTM